MATQFMTERLLKAALTLLAHGERVEVYDMLSWQKCWLLGEGREPRTVRMGVWCESGELQQAREFRYCRVPASTLSRLEAIAAEQPGNEVDAGAITDPPSAEVQRALEWAARAKQQRKRNGWFADCTHRAEPTGTR